jgi:GT2 family glycosyltransferase
MSNSGSRITREGSATSPNALAQNNRQLPSLTIAIPTYRREGVLIDTIEALLAFESREAELLVLDQTDAHTQEVADKLAGLSSDERIRLVHLSTPSIPMAMNKGLSLAFAPIVLFLDDDILPERGLIETHLAAHRDPGAPLVAGRVVQPWQEGVDYSSDADFHFASLRSAWIDQFMGGNFSVRRDIALEIGGFDENFVRVAYNFEAEFAHRLRRAGHKIYFAPNACIHHLKAESGGTRTFGDHLRTLRPDHAVGAYYFIIRTWNGWGSLRSFFLRPVRAVVTRHHFHKPWWIPLTIVGEITAMCWAICLAAHGPRYVSTKSSD